MFISQSFWGGSCVTCVSCNMSSLCLPILNTSGKGISIYCTNTHVVKIAYTSGEYKFLSNVYVTMMMIINTKNTKTSLKNSSRAQWSFSDILMKNLPKMG